MDPISYCSFPPKKEQTFSRLAYLRAFYAQPFGSSYLIPIYPESKDSFSSPFYSLSSHQRMSKFGRMGASSSSSKSSTSARKTIVPIQETHRISSSGEVSGDEASSEFTSPFQHGETVFYQIGGRSSTCVFDSITCFDDTFTRYEVLTRLNRKLELSCSAISNTSPSDEIFIAGGRERIDDSKGSDEVELFLVRERRRVPLDTLFRARFDGSGIKYGDLYYVCGGSSDTSDLLSTVEIYKIETGYHYAAPPMLCPRTGFQVVQSRNCLYAIGGNFLSRLNVEIYDSRDRSWSFVSNSTSPDPIYNSTSCVDGNGIYVCTSDKFYCFDTVAAQWRTLPSPNLSFNCHQSVLHENKFYKISGFNRGSSAPSFSFYDLTKGRWQPSSIMAYGVANSAMFVGSYS